jgi:hypothetical protein
LSDFLDHVRSHAESSESDSFFTDLFSEEEVAASLSAIDKETPGIQDDIIDSLAASIPPDLDLVFFISDYQRLLRLKITLTDSLAITG